MFIRIITALIGLVVFFAVLFGGSLVFTIGISAVVFIMLSEMYKAIKSNLLLKIIGYLSSASILSSIIFGQVSLELVIILNIFVYLAVMVHQHTVITYKEISANAFMTLFISVFFGTMIRLYNDFNIYGVLIVFICAWMTDTGAYFTGLTIGKHKLIPKVSPKKTVEGAIGGIITAGLSAMLYIYILECLNLPHGFNYLSMFVGACIASVCSQLGDLVASSIKRDCNVKDFGNILPGHGGMVDRFDSVIYITPIVYYLLVYLK